MGEKQCSKCGEMVDDAKAFCPGCGNAFVEEKKRTSVSEFEQLDHTVRLGDTMYNQMLSDMGLNVSKQPNRAGKNTDAVVTPEPEVSSPVAPDSGPSMAVIAVLGFALLTAVALAVIYLYSR